MSVRSGDSSTFPSSRTAISTSLFDLYSVLGFPRNLPTMEAFTLREALLLVIFCLVILPLGRFLIKLYDARQAFKRHFQDRGLPMPPHNPILGHVPLAASIVMALPSHAHHFYLGDQIRRRYPELDTAFYLDLWPFGPTMLMVIAPDIMHQFTQDRYLPKHEGVRQFMKPMTGEHDMVTMEGQMWKRWRSIFNPGFSAGHIMTLIPGIVEEVVVFRNLLRERAKRKKNDIFQLEKLALNLSIDIIGKVVLDHKLNSQTAPNQLTSALRRQLSWCTVGIETNPLEHLNVVRPLVHWYNTYRMDSYISRELESRYDLALDKPKSKSVVDLALKSYLAERSPPQQKATAMDATFRKFVRSQIKLFLLAGHDTTSATSVYVFYLLSKHPSVLARVREEHTAIIGRDCNTTPSLLASTPHLLNQLPLTLAVIKEALRLFPQASTARAGDPSFVLFAQDGCEFPTEDCLVWGNHHGIHHNPRYWPRVEEFLPERWLVAEGDPLYPTKDAWRAFERGPRNCLGQELALTELKIILVMTLREFEIADAYQEWDARKGNTNPPQVDGERAFQIIRGGGHPSDFFPCCVRFREMKEINGFAK